jgi:hypothetical protein
LAHTRKNEGILVSKIFGNPVPYLVTSELLAYSKLIEPGVVQLLRKNRFGLCLCVHKGELNEELHLVCNVYKAAGIPIILWPLLSVTEGLYLNKYSVNAYDNYLDELFAWLAERKHRIYGILVDCEPDYERPKPDSASPVLDNIWNSLRDLDEDAFLAAITGFKRIIQKIRAHNCKAIGAALPFVFHDIPEKSQAWQDYWGGPVVSVDWDIIVFMLFGSWFVQMGMNWPTAHYLIYDYSRKIKKIWHHDAVVALGVTTPGTGAETAVYRSPDELAAAVSAVKAAGVKRIGIYDLKGIMESENPDLWLRKIRNAPPLKPDGGLLPESGAVNHLKVILYKGMVNIAGEILELIRSFKSACKRILHRPKGTRKRILNG